MLLAAIVLVTGMSVVVNICAPVGVFTAVAETLERTTPNGANQRRRVLLAEIIVISLVVTVLLSLNTRPNLLTPPATPWPSIIDSTWSPLLWK